MRRSRGRTSTTAALCALVLPLALAGCGGKPKAKASAAAEAPTAVQTARVEAPGAGEPIRATGVLRRVRETVLSFRIPGVITRLTVDEGDPVAAGQVIATLDPAGVDARMRQAAADLAKAKREVARFEPLVEKGAVSREQLDTQRTTLASASAAYDAAAFDRRWATLRAPSSGVVLVRTAQTGEVVNIGQAVVTMADTGSPLVLRAPITDRDVGRVRMGMPVTVRLDSMPGRTLSGRVSRVGQRARAENGQVEVEATVAAEPGLRSGMLGSLEMAAAGGPVAGGGFARVPAEAVMEASGGRAAVLRVDGGRVRRTAVSFGGFDGDHALIGGLEPGTEVVTAGAGYVSDGEKVTVVDPARLAAGR